MKRRLEVRRTRVRYLLLTMGFALAVPAAVQGQAAVDTIVAQSADLVAAAVASALSQQGMLGAAPVNAVARAMTSVLEQSSTGGVRTASLELDSAGLAQVVLPTALQYVGSSGGRYLIDIILTQVAGDAQTRVQIAPLFIANVTDPGNTTGPWPASPLGGRQLPSAGVVEQQTLANIMSALPGIGGRP